MAKICAIMQPTYFPWLGYLALIDAADCFVFLDDVKLEKSSWHVRNRIKTAQGIQFITVPVIASQGRLETHINQALPDERYRWRHKHLNSLKMAYSKSLAFAQIYPWVESLLDKQVSNLAELNIQLIRAICEGLNISTQWFLSSELGCEGSKDQRLTKICQAVDCQTYLSPRGSAVYIEAERPGGAFPDAGISLLYQQYQPVAYPQRYGDFIPFLSVLDLLFNLGWESGLELIRQGIQEPLAYQQIQDSRL